MIDEVSFCGGSDRAPGRGRARRLAVGGASSWLPWLALGLALWVGCADPGGAGEGVEEALPPGDRSACGALPEAPEVEVEAHITGPTGNSALVSGDVAWVVQSGDNTVGRLELTTGRYEAGFVDVGNGRNPWAVAEADGRLYITNFLADSVTVADAATGEVLTEIEGFDGPTGIAAGAGLVVVANSSFVGPGFDAGFVLALRPTDEGVEVTARMPTLALNPVGVTFDEARARFYVVSAGDVGADPETGAFQPRSDAAIDVFLVEDLALGRANSMITTSVPLPLDPTRPFAGSPRSLVMAPGGAVAYLPSGTAPHLYKLDLETLEVLRGPSDPIEVYLGEGNQLTGLALRPDGVGYVTAFNQDALYLFDTSCDASVLGPIDLGRSPLLEGPLEIAHDPATGQAVVVMSVSSSLTVVRD